MSSNKEIGLFFYIDPRTGNQCIRSIEPAFDLKSPEATAERFRLRDSDPIKLPQSIRVVPPEVLKTSDELLGQSARYWSPLQLVKNDVRLVDILGLPDTPAPAPPYDITDGWQDDGTQFHRNFFVIIFDKNGNLSTQRRAWIWDTDPEGVMPSVQEPGWKTGLVVKRTPNLPVNLDYENGVINEEDQPILFAPTTGVIVYRNDDFTSLPQADDTDYNDDHRKFLAREGISFTIEGVGPHQQRQGE